MRSARSFLLLIAATLSLSMQSHVVAPSPIPAAMRPLPRVTVWAWQRREDLSGIDPRTTAVAYLDRTLTQDGPILRTNLERNALLLPTGPGLSRIAVIRIETNAPQMTPDSAQKIATEIANVANRHPHLAALQVDFDATLSQRAWYRTILAGLREQMPAGMPLSITALASWCSGDRWMQGLPVDEAVPMLFRMEPGMSGNHNLPIREPLCMGSVGISTREDWPRAIAGKRVYLFPDDGWLHDDVTQTLKALR